MNEIASGNIIPYKSMKLEEISNRSIAEYGFKHENKESELEETYRTEIRRQRDKILYTGGFRRLQDKTQVMSATLTGDHRTRLTHTLEVEQIAISFADALGLNKDLVSAIALGHDVGHTPFGHAAERTLDILLEDNGGFHHPIQSAKYLWEKYGDNLIKEIYEGILAHDSDMFTIDKEKVEKQLMWSEYYVKESDSNIPGYARFKDFFNSAPSTLEAQAVIWADKIAYITHDLEDFLQSPIYTSAIKAENNSHSNNKDTEKKLCELLSDFLTDKTIESIKDFKSRDLIRTMTTNLIITSAKNINSIKGLKQEEVKFQTKKRLDKITESNEKKKYLNSLLINFDEGFRNNYYQLREFLNEEYIFSPHVQHSDAKAQKIISSLYKEFTENYKLTPLEIRMKIENETKKLAEKYMSKQKMSEEDIKEIMKKKIKFIENEMKLQENSLCEYKSEKAKVIGRIVASYISTMSDTYAENMFCNLNYSKDNYSL